MVRADDNTSRDADRPDLLALLFVLWDSKLVIILATFVCGGLALWYALMATHIYRAEVSITEVNNQNGGVAAALASQLGGLASLMGAGINSGGSDTREAKAMLRSRRVAEEFVQRHDLVPVLLAQNVERPPTLWLAVRRFRQDILSIREDVQTGITTVAVNWPDPAVAAAWANNFVALVNELLRVRAMEQAKASIEYLNDQVTQTNIVEMQRVMYGLIENETKTLMLANARHEYAFAVIDPAVPPESRVSPRRSLIVLFGLAVGFLFGLAAAFLRNMIRHRRALHAT